MEAPGWLSQLGIQILISAQSGHDLPVHGIKPCIRHCTDSAEPAWDSLSVPLLLTLSLSLKINKHF